MKAQLQLESHNFLLIIFCVSYKINAEKSKAPTLAITSCIIDDWMNIFDIPATIIIISAINKNLPIKEKSFLVVIANIEIPPNAIDVIKNA